jgi:hypothetical protein
MRTERQIEAAAAAAAEKANGGKFVDPLFYKSEHRALWREVIRTALDTADATPPAEAEVRPKVSPMEVAKFRDHCVYIRSVYLFLTRVWRDSDAGERKVMEAIAPLFFTDMTQVLSEYMIIAACRVTESAQSALGNENFTVELFVNSFSSEPDTFKQLDALHKRMKKLRAKILPARHRYAAHADREAIRSGKPLGEASWEEWDEFWAALKEFVSSLNEKTMGWPFEIDAAGVRGDAEMLIKAFKQSQHFEKLLNGNDVAVRDACLRVALPKA